MIWDEKLLQTLFDCGQFQLSVDDTSTILCVTPEELRKELNNKNSDAYKKYHSGKMTAEFEVRKSIYNLATNGSSQAQELWLKLRDELKIDEA